MTQTATNAMMRVAYVRYRTDDVETPALASAKSDLRRNVSSQGWRRVTVNGGQQVPNLLDELRWREADHASNGLSSSEQQVDTENGYAVLDFVYRYLKACSRPPNDSEVRKVTSTIARYQGPRLVQGSTLESLLAGPSSIERA
jgi:hypothetical protein